MASTLYACLVDGGEEAYSTFISYRVFSEKFHAMLLHEALNNTVTPAGHRVINYLDVKRLVSAQDWEQGFSRGLLKSLVALPMVSTGCLEPMLKLTGGPEDRPDNVAKELQIMHAMMDANESGIVGSPGKLQAICPILVGKPTDDGDKRTGNFFQDGSSRPLDKLVEKVSPATTKAVEHFLVKSGLPISEGTRNRTVASTVSRLLALPGAHLWDHEDLQSEMIEADSDMWKAVQQAQSAPPLDLHQLRMLKAELRALVPMIHEVVDRAHADHMKRNQTQIGMPTQDSQAISAGSLYAGLPISPGTLSNPHSFSSGDTQTIMGVGRASEMVKKNFSRLGYAPPAVKPTSRGKAHVPIISSSLVFSPNVSAAFAAALTEVTLLEEKLRGQAVENPTATILSLRHQIEEATLEHDMSTLEREREGGA